MHFEIRFQILELLPLAFLTFSLISQKTEMTLVCNAWFVIANVFLVGRKSKYSRRMKQIVILKTLMFRLSEGNYRKQSTMVFLKDRLQVYGGMFSTYRNVCL